MKKIKKRFIAALMVVMMCSAMVVTAFAAGEDYDWFQATKPTYTVHLGTLNPGSNINTCGVRASAVVSSAMNGTYQVKFQYRNILGIWCDVGPTFTKTQHAERRYDTVTNTYVLGEPFVITAASTKKAEYRLVFFNPTAPQKTAILDVRSGTYGN